MKKIKQKMKFLVPIVMVISLLFVVYSTTDIGLADDTVPPYPENYSSIGDLSDDTVPPYPERIIRANNLIFSGVN